VLQQELSQQKMPAELSSFVHKSRERIKSLLHIYIKKSSYFFTVRPFSLSVGRWSVARRRLASIYCVSLRSYIIVLYCTRTVCCTVAIAAAHKTPQHHRRTGGRAA